MFVFIRALVGILAVAGTLGGAFAQSFVDGDSANRIEGGRDVDPTKYSFYVSFDQGCAGTLVAPDVVATSSHCLDDGASTNLNVTVLSSAMELNETRSIVGITRHPKYHENSLAYDIAVVLLDDIVEGAVPVEINVDDSFPMMGDNLTVVGFASNVTFQNGEFIESHLDNLQEGIIQAFNDTTCIEAYGEQIWQGNATMLCAGNDEGGNVNNCADDRGGPLLDEENMLVGIVSLGTACGQKDLPGVFTRASFFYDWIEWQVCTMSAVPPSHCEALLESFFPTGNASNSIVISIPPPKTSDPSPDDITLPPEDLPAAPPTDPIPDAGAAPGGDSSSNGDSSGVISIAVDIGNDRPPAPEAEPQALELKLEIYYDAYGIENAWVLRNLDADEIIDEKKYYTVAPAGLSTSVYHNLNPGNYSFTIQDYANDGICCGFGEGFVRITQVYDDDVVDIDNRELWYLEGDFEALAEARFELLPYDAVPETETDVELSKTIP